MVKITTSLGKAMHSKMQRDAQRPLKSPSDAKTRSYYVSSNMWGGIADGTCKPNIITSLSTCLNKYMLASGWPVPAGRAPACGAQLSCLGREAVGGFMVLNACTLDVLIQSVRNYRKGFRKTPRPLPHMSIELDKTELQLPACIAWECLGKVSP